MYNTSNISDKIDTTSNVEEIPFPLKREISSKHWNKTFTFTINYQKLFEQVKCFNENKLQNLN